MARSKARERAAANQLALITEKHEVILGRDTIREGDQIFAWGGPAYGTTPLTGRGKKRYLVNGFFFKRGRTWLDCTRLESALSGAPKKTGRDINDSFTVAAGRFLLFVAGANYTRAAFPGVRWRPFKVRKVKTR